MEVESTRHSHRLRAQRRAKREKISFLRALYLVRRSAVLIYLERQERRSVEPSEIARATAVPLGAVRTILQGIQRAAARTEGR